MKNICVADRTCCNCETINLVEDGQDKNFIPNKITVDSRDEGKTGFIKIFALTVPVEYRGEICKNSLICFKKTISKTSRNIGKVRSMQRKLLKLSRKSKLWGFILERCNSNLSFKYKIFPILFCNLICFSARQNAKSIQIYVLKYRRI